MKLTLQFELINKADAVGQFLHNKRAKGHFESNLKIDGVKGGIHNSKVLENYSLIEAIYPTIWEKANIVNDKIIGGLQKKSKTYTSWVVQAGNEHETLEIHLNKNFILHRP